MPNRDYVFYEETAVWPAWVVAVVGVAVAAAAAAAGADLLRGIATGRLELLARGAGIVTGAVGLAVAVRTFLGRLRVVVSRTSVTLTYGYTPLIRKLIGFDEIEDVEAVRYSPLREFGGWGLRYGGGGKRAWTIRGDGAVVLTLHDGTRLYVGSDRPRRLAERIRAAMAMAGRSTAVSEEATLDTEPE